MHDGGGSSSHYSTPSSGMRLRHSSSEPMGEYSGSSSSMYGGGQSEHGTSSQQPLTPLDIMRMESESGQGQMMQLIPDQNYLRERADVMETVESHMLELGNIFNKLAVMVNEHRDMVQRVEDAVMMGKPGGGDQMSAGEPSGSGYLPRPGKYLLTLRAKSLICVV